MIISKKVFSLKQNIEIKQRNEKVEFFKGLAMILVLLHHCFVPLNELILLFHMPLFFIISGYVDARFNNKNYCFKDYFIKRFKRLIIPYIIFELINLFIWLIICIVNNNDLNLFYSLLSIISCINSTKYTGLCGRLWFLPCMFVSNILFYFIKKICKYNWQKAITLILLLVLSYVFSYIIPYRLPFTFDTAMLATFFIFIGYLTNNSMEKLINNTKYLKDLILLLSLICIFVIIFKIGNPKMLMYINQYGNYYFSILEAIIGSTIFIIISKYIYKVINNFNTVKNIVLWYSNNSLMSFPVHLQIKCILLLISQFYFSRFIILFPITFILNIIVVNIISNIISYYFSRKYLKLNR